MPQLQRLLGNPTLELSWEQVDAVERVRGGLPLPMNHGVSFMVNAKRLVFWCRAAQADAIIEKAAHYVPDKLETHQELKRIW
jgi:hypothetical protein